MADRRASMSAPNVVGGGPRKGGPPPADFDFNLGNAKAKVLRSMDENRAPSIFRKFYNSALYDRMLQTVLLYFVAIFQHEWIIKTMERSRKQHLEGYNPYAVAARIRELEDELATLKMELSPIYSEIILKYSSYEKPQQDRLFFEALYETLIGICDEAFTKLSKRPEIEQEVGSLFRSKHFNMYRRTNQPPRSVDTLSVKELYAIKHETSNRALNAKMLSSLFEKPPTIGVTVASVTNSPLITQYIMSPIVARSMMKDPAERQKMFDSLAKAGATSDPRKASARSTASVFRSVAMMKGVDPSKIADMKLPSDAAAGSLGMIPSNEARRSDRVRAPTGMLAPEAAGLPVDEVFNYMALLKRYIVYGPSLGVTAQPGGHTVGALSGSVRTESMSGGSLGFALERGGAVSTQASVSGSSPGMTAAVSAAVSQYGGSGSG